MISIAYGFFGGFIIPFIARRLGKILPASMGEILFHLIHLPKCPKNHNPIQYKAFKKKWGKLIVYSLCMGIITSTLFWISQTYLPKQTHLYSYAFVWICLCAAETDKRHFLLPDCLTMPLLLLGFTFATQTKLISPQESLYGAFFAYIITTLSVLIICFKKNTLFGAGDIKMAIALGSWLGIQGLNYSIFVSFFLFLVYILCLKKRSAAYGPALGISGLFTFFILYTK